MDKSLNPDRSPEYCLLKSSHRWLSRFLVTALSMVLLLGPAGCGGSSGDGGSGGGSSNNTSKFIQSMRLNNGRLAALFLTRKRDGKVTFRGYPHGLKFAAQAGPAIPVTDQELNLMIYGRRTHSSHAKARSAAAEPTATATPVTGFTIGLNESTGSTVGPCFNFTIGNPGAAIDNVDNFNTLSAASSVANVFNARLSVSGTYEGFSASNDFTYSDNYNSTSFSSSYLFSASALYNLPITIQNPAINAFGMQEEQAGDFAQACGSEVYDVVGAGMLIVGELSFSSNSSQSNSSVSEKMTANDGAGGLQNLDAASMESNMVADSSNSFDFTLDTYGGGEDSTNALKNALEANSQNLADCSAGVAAQPNQADACTMFTSNLNTAAGTAIDDFTNAVMNGTQDYADFEQFPNGIVGASTQPTILTEPVSDIAPVSADDPFQDYSSQLSAYTTLMNQVSTLNQRATAINAAVTPTITSNNQTTNYNTNQVDLIGDSANLMTAYSTALDGAVGPGQPPLTGSMISNLGVCLGYLPPPEGAETVAEDCDPIINNLTSGSNPVLIDSAYEYFSTDNPNLTAQNFTAQQNAIALQYNVLNNSERACDDKPCGQENNPMQAMYVVLPGFAGTSGAPIQNLASMTAFVDQEWTATNGKGHPMLSTDNWVVILPMGPESPLPDLLNMDMFTAMNTAPISPGPQFWGIINDGWYSENSFPDTIFTGLSTQCSTMITVPCAFEVASGFDKNGRGSLSLTYTPIASFFN